jgi:hypothetical protein
MSVPMSPEELVPVLRAGGVPIEKFRPSGKVAPALSERSL